MTNLEEKSVIIRIIKFYQYEYEFDRFLSEDVKLIEEKNSTFITNLIKINYLIVLEYIRRKKFTQVIKNSLKLAK